MLPVKFYQLVALLGALWQLKCLIVILKKILIIVLISILLSK